MGKTLLRTLTFILPVVFFLVKDGHGREIARSDNNQNVTDVAAFRPVLTKDRLYQIRVYDSKMKCFPLILCTLTKTGAFAALGIVSLNDLADGYIRLLSVFPGGPASSSSDLVMGNAASNFKNDFGALKSSSPDDDDENAETQKTRDDENESEELLLSDPLLHHKEKLEMKKLMDELMAEDRAEAMRKPTSWTNTAMSLPFKLGTSLLREVVAPLFVGDTSRRGRDLEEYFNIKNNDGRDGKAIKLDKNQDLITSAMKHWNKLKSPQECGKIYKSCPFEAWEVVSMIKLIKDSSVRQ